MSARLFALIATLIAGPGAAVADTLTYRGEDAERLKCAAMLSLASNFAKSEGRMTKARHATSMAAVAQLLDGLPGDNAEKTRAMQAMADRIMLASKPAALKADFQLTLPACGRFF